MARSISAALGLGALAAGTLTAAPAAAEAGDFQARLRLITVAPTESAGPVLPTFPGGSVSVDNAWAPEIDFTYFVTNNIGLELIASTTKHNISGTGDLGGLGEIAETKVLPPTLTVQYHFNPDGKFRPYLGAGINYTIFYDEKSSDGLEAAIDRTTVDLDDSFGWALQAGIDFALSERWFLNADIKYIDIDTTATLENSNIGINTVDVDLDPIVAGFGVGYRF